MAKRIVIPMEDPIIHTVARPVCTDPECICYDLEMEQAQADMDAEKDTARHHRTLVSSPEPALSSSLNGDRAFRYLR